MVETIQTVPAPVRPSTFTNRRWGKCRASLDELDTIPIPRQTDTYMPVPQSKLFNMWAGYLEGVGFSISDPVHWTNGKQFLSLVGISRVDLQNSGLGTGFHFTAGILNSYDKSRAISTGVGTEVFACMNGMFSAEIQMKTKHTSFVFDRLQPFIYEAAASTSNRASAIYGMFKEYASVEVCGNAVADHVVVEAARRGIIPSTGIMDVLGHWRIPEHPEFSERTVWSLYNAFTSYNRGRSMFASLDRSARLHSLLKDTFHLQRETPEEVAAKM